MKKIVNLAYILTILIFIDLTATLFWVHGGLATEANPIMNFFFASSSVLFVVAKLGFSFTGLYILYICRKRFRKAILHIFLGLNLIYLGVCGYHLWGLLFLILKTI
jgi:hypothetical protein